jgi:hypothetical protein
MSFDDLVFKILEEKKDACYKKVKAKFKVFPSLYAGAALKRCRNKKKSKKKKSK